MLSPTHTSISNFDLEDEDAAVPEQEHTSYTDLPTASDIPDLFLARSEEEANKSNSVVLLNEDNQGIILCKLHGSTYFSYTNTKRSLTRSTAHSTTGQFLK